MKLKPSSYSNAVIVVTITMLIVLPLLAYLQYTWLGALSEQEFERMQKNVRTAALLFSMDFSKEVIELVKSLDGDLPGTDASIQAELRSRLTTWKSAATYPNLTTGEIEISSSFHPEQVIDMSFDPRARFFILKDFSAIVIPLRNNLYRNAIVSLNRTYIASTVLQGLARNHFSSDGIQDYDIVIADNEKKVLFASTDSVADIVLSSADITTPFFFTIPPFRGEFEPGETSAPPRDRLFSEEHRSDERIGTRFFEGRMKPPRTANEPSLSQQPEPPFKIMEMRMQRPEAFTMYIKHRNGSLEAAVSNNRVRNLAVSFGVLILLASGVIFLLISSHRAQQLAVQQLEFVASISHELRTPLAVLKSAVENLADGVIREPERARQYGSVIKNEVTRLSEMVEKSLTYSGIRSGKQRFEMQVVDLSSIIENAVLKAKKLLEEEFTLETAVVKNLPVINGNSAALQSALENLIMNAIKYSGETKWARIEAEPVLNSTFVKITVTDRGIGIPKRDLSKIFIPFHRGQNAVDAQIEGSGLGLSIAKHIIEAHGGTVTVKSTVNIGSEFIVHLPVISIKDGAHV